MVPKPAMPRSKSSVGVSSAVMTSQEEPLQLSHRGDGTLDARQRRHSWHTKPCAPEADNFHVLVRYTRMHAPLLPTANAP